METKQEVKKAIFNMGGRAIASKHLRVSVSTVGKWIRNGVIPNLIKAREVSKASGFGVETLRPQYKQ